MVPSSDPVLVCSAATQHMQLTLDLALGFLQIAFQAPTTIAYPVSAGHIAKYFSVYFSSNRAVGALQKSWDIRLHRSSIKVKVSTLTREIAEVWRRRV